jgi:hypothetical protein
LHSPHLRQRLPCIQYVRHSSLISLESQQGRAEDRRGSTPARRVADPLPAAAAAAGPVTAAPSV